MSAEKTDVQQGTLDLMILKTIQSMGPLHGYAIARRIEQVSSDTFSVNQGTLYPALLRLEQRRWIRSHWGTSGTGRKVKFYSLTRLGEPKVAEEEENWSRIVATMARFLSPAE
jgi:transcriptional regulator